MKSALSSDSQTIPVEKQLLGVNAKTGLYPGARSWSGGRKRILGRAPLESHCYHVMSRTCGGEVFLDDVEREALRRVIWRMAEFAGIKVVTYCIMSNHFHLLAEVPHRESWMQRFEGAQGEAKLLEHLRTLYSKTYVGLLREELADLRARGMSALADLRIAAIKKRFCDLSLFVKEVKERYSRWFNKRRGRRGTLWMDRFKSVLVEGKGEALRTIAAYIDLNPVRAGLVQDPKDYRWCGYAEALVGNKEAQRGICRITARAENAWKTGGAAEAYRQILFDSGREVRSADNSKVVRRGVSKERVREVLERRGKLTPGELVRCKVRHFTDGAVIGSKEFVNAFFEGQRERFGSRRKDGARRIREVEGDLHSLRDLKKRVLN